VTVKVSGLKVKPSSPTSTLWTVLDAEAALEEAVEDAPLLMIVSSEFPDWALMNGRLARTKKSMFFIVRSLRLMN
jgi:hypothetical protein